MIPAGDLSPLDRATLAAIAQLPPETPIQVTLRAGDLTRALELRAATGPEVLSAKEAARRFGYAAERWRRWCERGLIAGAWQDAEGGPWRLPRASAEAHLRQLQSRGARATGDAQPAAHAPRRKPHGPRRKARQSGAAGSGGADTPNVVPLLTGEPHAARPHSA